MLDEATSFFTFVGVEAEPVPSLLRGFSAPVVPGRRAYSDAELLVLLAHDTDPFNRWEAGQRLALNRAARAPSATAARRRSTTPSSDAMRSVLRHPQLDAAFKELVLTLPGETYIAEQLDVVDPQRVHAVREAMREQLAQALRDDWDWAYEAHQGQRRLLARSGVRRPPRAGRPGAHDPVPRRARRAATPSGPARPTSASRTRPT